MDAKFEEINLTTNVNSQIIDVLFLTKFEICVFFENGNYIIYQLGTNKNLYSGKIIRNSLNRMITKEKLLFFNLENKRFIILDIYNLEKQNEMYDYLPLILNNKQFINCLEGKNIELQQEIKKDLIFEQKSKILYYDISTDYIFIFNSVLSNQTDSQYYFFNSITIIDIFNNCYVNNFIIESKSSNFSQNAYIYKYTQNQILLITIQNEKNIEYFILSLKETNEEKKFSKHIINNFNFPNEIIMNIFFYKSFEKSFIIFLMNNKIDSHLKKIDIDNNENTINLDFCEGKLIWVFEPYICGENIKIIVYRRKVINLLPNNNFFSLIEINFKKNEIKIINEIENKKFDNFAFPKTLNYLIAFSNDNSQKKNRNFDGETIFQYYFKIIKLYNDKKTILLDLLKKKGLLNKYGLFIILETLNCLDF